MSNSPFNTLISFLGQRSQSASHSAPLLVSSSQHRLHPPHAAVEGSLKAWGEPCPLDTVTQLLAKSLIPLGHAAEPQQPGPGQGEGEWWLLIPAHSPASAPGSLLQGWVWVPAHGQHGRTAAVALPCPGSGSCSGTGHAGASWSSRNVQNLRMPHRHQTQTWRSLQKAKRG